MIVTLLLNFFARVYSYLFHPLLLLTYAFLLLMWINPFVFGSPNFSDAWGRQDINVIMIFFSTVLLPAITMILMKFLEMLNTLKMEDKQERIGPYIATGIFYLWIFFNINGNPQLPQTLKIFALGVTIALFAAFFVNNFRKISIYTVGMGSLVAMSLMNWQSATAVSGMLLFQIIIVVAGGMGTARLILKANEPNDVYGGYLIGFMSQFVAFVIIIQFLS